MPKRNHRRKELSESQKLKHIVKEQKAEIRSLQKQVRELQRLSHVYEDIIIDEDSSDDTDLPKRTPCIECGKGYLMDFYICGRYWQECDLCDFRTKTTKVEE